ncbi:MAG: DNA/RNA nuclease SfsA [Planctomycetota bacterium]
MKPFPTPLLDGVLLRRRKRFLADIRLADGREVTAHCANPGAMTTCCEAARPVLLSDRGGGTRRLRYTWEMIRIGRGWVGVNTAVANRVVEAWLRAGRVLPDAGPVRREVAVEGSRLDFGFGGRGLLEVKSVTLARDGVAAFPDAVTERGRRHVETLAALRVRGWRSVLLYFVTRTDARSVRPADEIDPDYGRALRAAVRAGVEVIALQARFSRQGVARGPPLPVLL